MLKSHLTSNLASQVVNNKRKSYLRYSVAPTALKRWPLPLEAKSFFRKYLMISEIAALQDAFFLCQNIECDLETSKCKNYPSPSSLLKDQCMGVKGHLHQE